MEDLINLLSIDGGVGINTYKAEETRATEEVNDVEVGIIINDSLDSVALHTVENSSILRYLL